MGRKRCFTGKPANYVFVLWGDKFEEATAAIFATQLRKAGLCVRVVGLAGKSSVGANGLGLMSDITLREAIPVADHAICVIMPCSTATVKRIENDPRVFDLFQKARDNDAYFVLNHTDAIERSSMKTLSIPEDHIAAYASTPNLTEFARQFAGSLSGIPVAN